MPRKSKTAEACKAMAEFGVPATKVKAALKELLNVYDNEWKFIEDDNYRALLDYVLESKPEKNEKMSKKRVRRKLDDDLVNKLPSPPKRLQFKGLECSPETCYEMFQLFEVEVSSSSLIPLNPEEYESLDSKQKFLESLENFGSQSLKTSPRRVRQSEAGLSSGLLALPGSEECESMVERVKPMHQKENSPLIIQYDDLELELEESKLVRKKSRRRKKGVAEQSQACGMEKVEELSEFCIGDESQSFLYPQILRNNEKRPDSCQSYEAMGENEPSNKRAKLNYESSHKSLPVSVTPIDADNVLDMYNPQNHLIEEPPSSYELKVPCDQYRGDEYPCEIENCSGVEKEVLKISDHEFLQKEGEASMSMNTSEEHLNIAQSLMGEVKMFLKYDSSQQPNFSVPCLDDVLNVVDEKYCKSYNVLAPGFTANLMLEVCQCFLTMGTNIVNDQPKKPQEREFCVSPSLTLERVGVYCQFKLVPGIPRQPSPSWLDNIHYFIGFWMNDMNPVLGGHRMIKLIESQNFSIQTKGNVGAVQNDHSSPLPPVVAKLFESVVDISIRDKSLKITFANGSSTEFFHVPINVVKEKDCLKKIAPPAAQISDVDSCLSYVMDCMLRQIPRAVTYETCCIHSRVVELMVGHIFNLFSKDGHNGSSGGMTAIQRILPNLQMWSSEDGLKGEEDSNWWPCQY